MKKFNLKLSIVIMSIFLLHNVNAQRRMSVRTANPVTHWESGSIDANRLTPRTGNSKVWNNVKFKPGEYEVTFEVVDLRPNRPNTDKVNLKIRGLYRNSNTIRDDEKIEMDTGNSPKIFYIREYNSKAQYRKAVPYGKVKISASKSNIRTNAKFKITIDRLSPITVGYDIVKIQKTNNRLARGKESLSGHSSSLGNSFVRTQKRISTDGAKIVLKKLGGKAKTLFKIYTSNTANGTKSNRAYYEFPHTGRAIATVNDFTEIELDNVRDKYIHIEIDNQSAALDFHWKIKVFEKYDH